MDNPDNVKRRELFDFCTEPQDRVNIADLPENAELVERLTEYLETGWREALAPRSKEECSCF